MMNCNEFESNIFQLIEGQEFNDKAACMLHIASCSKCNKLYDTAIRDYAFIEQEKKLKANPFMASKVMLQLEKQTNNRQVPKLVHRFALMAAMVSGLFIGFAIGGIHPTTNTLASNEQMEETAYFDDFQQESIEYNLISEEE